MLSCRSLCGSVRAEAGAAWVRVPPDVGQLTCGVMMARRAGATKPGVTNCMSRPASARWLAGVGRQVPITPLPD